MNAKVPSTSTGDALNAQLLVLSTLIQLEKQARKAETLTELGFLIANDTHRLLSYKLAVVWQIRGKKAELHAVSGVSVLDRNAPMLRYLQQVLQQYSPVQTQLPPIHNLDLTQISDNLREEWQAQGFGQGLWCRLQHPRLGYLGGVLLLRQTPWQDSDITLMSTLNDAYTHAWGSLSGKPPRVWLSKARKKLLLSLVFITVIAALFVPVHESVLAPAEVVAQQPWVVSAPLDGVIKTVEVQPNQLVAIGQVLFKLDDTKEKNSYLVATESLAVAKAELLSARQKAFSDIQSKAELALLETKVRQRQAEVNYLQETRERMTVTAEHAGIAVFTDVNDWLGKPVQVGEKVMTIADPQHTELLIWVSVHDAIPFQTDNRVVLFLDTDPVNPLEASLYQAAYQAEPTVEQTLAFRVKAKFADAQALPRLGLKGTAKLYGQQVPLYYYLFRRPWASVRQWLGM